MQSLGPPGFEQLGPPDLEKKSQFATKAAARSLPDAAHLASLDRPKFGRQLSADGSDSL
jgi:hypothetical protein